MAEERILHERTAWVTGASRGIGRAVATALAEAGAEVCIGARSMDELQNLADALNGRGMKVHAIQLDVASPDSIRAFSEKAVELAGSPTILVNNAGLGIFKDLPDMTPEDFDSQLNINVRGPWYLIKEAAPHMKREGGGWILNISSIAGSHAFKRGTAYCAGKAALNAMSECLMLELRDDDIRVITIAPGSVETSFHHTALPGAHHNDQSWMLEPETIAKACLHAISQPENALLNYYEIRPLRKAKQVK